MHQNGGLRYLFLCFTVQLFTRLLGKFDSPPYVETLWPARLKYSRFIIFEGSTPSYIFLNFPRYKQVY